MRRGALRSFREFHAMNRNLLVIVAAILAVTTAYFGYRYYQERNRTGMEISVGSHSMSIEQK